MRTGDIVREFRDLQTRPMPKTETTTPGEADDRYDFSDIHHSAHKWREGCDLVVDETGSSRAKISKWKMTRRAP
jgi:hypothetical protein